MPIWGRSGTSLACTVRCSLYWLHCLHLIKRAENRKRATPNVPFTVFCTFPRYSASTAENGNAQVRQKSRVRCVFSCLKTMPAMDWLPLRFCVRRLSCYVDEQTCGLESARIAMPRRGKQLTLAMEAQLRMVYDQTEGERDRGFVRAEHLRAI